MKNLREIGIFEDGSGALSDAIEPDEVRRIEYEGVKGFVEMWPNREMSRLVIINRGDYKITVVMEDYEAIDIAYIQEPISLNLARVMLIHICPIRNGKKWIRGQVDFQLVSV